VSEHLWAPWRLAYIKGEKEEGCIFCSRLARSSDESDFILHRGREAFIILNAFPYTNGHLMVVPNLHTSELEALSQTTHAEMNDLTLRAIAALRKTLRPNGFNVGMNLGKCAGAGVLDHVHQHIVPRWDGDTNFMPVTGGVHVVPDSLEHIWSELKRVF
jgi:ATP adenylyltransferase